MKLYTRILSALLCSAVAMGALAACGDDSSAPAPSSGNQTPAAADNGDAAETEPVETEDPHYAGISSAIPADGYDGYEFNVISYNDDGYWQIYVEVDGETGEVLNDAAYRRNLEVEDMLGIKIKQTRDENSENSFKQSVLAGSDDYDLICFWSPGNRSGFITQNLVWDWTSVPNLSLTSAWYNQTANDAYNIGGKQYFAVSDITYPVQQHFRILFNKSLITDLGLEMPYQSVYDGTWTFTKMMDYTKGVYQDINGNQKADLEDRYGMGLNAAFSSAFVWNAGEIQVTNSEDGFVINLISDRIQRIVSDIVAFRENPDIYFSKSGNDHYDVFKAGNSIFNPYGSDPQLLREYEVDFGYLMYPKYDDSQANYVVWSSGGLMAIPQTASDINRTGVIIETMSAASNKYVKDAFVEKYVESKVLRDDDSVTIYRMMRDLATYDLSYNIDPSGKLADYAYYSYFMNKSNADVASYYAKNETKIVTSYADLFEAATAE